MRLEGLRIKGLGPFRDELAIDFADYAGAKLVAITGDNGAGKTTMLELALPGAMYRGTPTRGSLADLATTRDAMLEVRFVNGARHTIRHLVDGVSGKSEAIVLNDAGAPELPDAKVRSFDAWAAKHLPAPEVLFTSIFGAQGADGFVGLKPGERKAVLLRCLGVERYEDLAERARERAKAQKLKVETLDARMVDERARQAGGIAAALGEATERVRGVEAQLANARGQLAEEEAEAARVVELERAAKDARARRAELDTQLATARQKLAAVEGKIANNREVLQEADAIRAAEAQATALGSEMDRMRTALGELRAAIASNEAEQQATKRLIDAATRERTAAEQRAAAARARLANEQKIQEAKAQVESRRKLLEQARAEVAKADAELTVLHEMRVAGSDERLTCLRRGLTMITELDQEGDSGAAPHIASNHLEADDDSERTAREMPAKVQAADVALRGARDRVVVVERHLREVEQLAAREPELVADRRDLAEATEAWEQASAGMALDREKLNAAAAALESLRGRVTSGEQGYLVAERARTALLERAALAAPLANAAARLSELEPQHRELAAEVAAIAAQVSATPAPPNPPAAPDVAAYRKVVDDCERALREALAAAAVARQRVADEQASVERFAALTAERAGLDDELADWNRLAADLGRDGLQAMVIDAAIPELNHTANELLHEAFGPRWTIDIRTQAIDAKGKRLLETLDVVVIDTEAGREGLAESLSGGERVIVQEAISLALTVLACRQSGVERPTLVRDESGAALAEGRAPQWIAMLRRAVDLIGADKCLFVSHTPATWELADARIHLGGAA